MESPLDIFSNSFQYSSVGDPLNNSEGAGKFYLLMF